MPISYKRLFNLLEKNGWTTYRIRKEKLMGQGTLTALKNGTGGLDSKTIAKLCKVLNCQPGDLMEYIPDETENDNNQNLASYFNMWYIISRKREAKEAATLEQKC